MPIHPVLTSSSRYPYSVDGTPWFGISARLWSITKHKVDIHPLSVSSQRLATYLYLSIIHLYQWLLMFLFESGEVWCFCSLQVGIVLKLSIVALSQSSVGQKRFAASWWELNAPFICSIPLNESDQNVQFFFAIFRHTDICYEFLPLM